MMKQTVTFSLPKLIAAIGAAILILGTATAQTATPVPTTAPAPVATPAIPQSTFDPANDPKAMALEPVRQAIGRQDYAAAKQALEQVRQNDPTNPGIPLYESLINRRQLQGQTATDGQSPLRTPRPGVTPMPSPVATPSPTPFAPPVAAPAPETAPAAPSAPAVNTASDDSIMGKAKALLDNEMVRYGIIGALALIALWVIFSFLRNRRDRPVEDAGTEDEVTPVSGVTTIGGMDDHLGDEEQPASFGLSGGGGLSSTAAPMDFSSDFTPGVTGAAETSAGLAGAAGAPEFTTFGSDEEEEAPKPRPKPAPKPAPVDDDAMVNIFAEDEPTHTPPPAAATAPEPQAPKEPSETVSFDALGINFGGETAPAQPASTSALQPPADEETVILSAPEAAPAQPPISSNPTPISSPSLTPGTVDLEDVLGAQPQPSLTDAPHESLNTPIAPQDTLDSSMEDANSETLPTFVSTPGVENPEESVEVAPKNQRRKSDDGEETQAISFEELFGSPEAAPQPEPQATPEPEPAPEAEKPAEISIEDALAATLGDMQAEAPDIALADETPQVPADEEPVESLDDRTERMFTAQMEKAHNAVAEKNWRQAVHVLSIASALHPENEEAKQMLKEARAEKRKSEESV